VGFPVTVAAQDSTFDDFFFKFCNGRAPCNRVIFFGWVQVVKIKTSWFFLWTSSATVLKFDAFGSLS